MLYSFDAFRHCTLVCYSELFSFYDLLLPAPIKDLAMDSLLSHARQPGRDQIQTDVLHDNGERNKEMGYLRMRWTSP